MNFKELVEERRSVRRYSDREVEQSKLDYILECARLAPSAVNRQPWHFAVVRSREARERLQRCYGRDWLSTAPVCIVVLADRNVSWKRPFDGHDHADIDAAIAAEHICLAATEQGLGSCWICNFDPAEFAVQFPQPEGVYPVVIIPIGYAADEPREKSRRPLSETVSEL